MRMIGLAVVLALGLTLAPLAAEAQPAARGYRIGVLFAAPATAVTPYVEALRERLRELGYVEGQNLALELRWSTPGTLAAKRATSTIPIVMVAVADPVGTGLVASLSRPGVMAYGAKNTEQFRQAAVYVDISKHAGRVKSDRVLL